MARVKRGNVARKRRKKILKATKGFRGAQNRLFTTADRAFTKAGKNAYRDRRNKKRDFRALWIVRINAGARQLGIRYSALIDLLKKNEVDLDRKQLADLAMNNFEAFKNLVEGLKK
ncbi:MAG: 50S ribosomal protein L20 [Candidatus Caenarcaniphilales bacterium]|nr:50S ribosomal protein L20 [Candidatus Caenarcaniphilales bacterium]